MNNLLPNTQWQTFSMMPYGTKLNPQGTGTIFPIDITGYTSAYKNKFAYEATFYTTNTDYLNVGDVGYITHGEDAITRVPMSVTQVIPNHSFNCTLPFQMSTTTSAPTQFIPITVGDFKGVTGDACDGWQKSLDLLVWRDTYLENSKPGSQYSLGVKLKSLGNCVCYLPSAADIKKLAGKTVTFGCYVYQKARQGAGTWTLQIKFDKTMVTKTCPVKDGYNWVEVTCKIGDNPNFVGLYIVFDGSPNEVYYVSQPMMIFGDKIGEGNYSQNPNEYIDFLVHVNPPILTPYAGKFPTTPVGEWVGYEFDLMATTFCQIARTVKAMNVKWEVTTPTPGINLFSVNYLGAPQLFGPQVVTQVADQLNASMGMCPIDQGNLFGQGYFALSSGPYPGVYYSNITIDISGALLS